MRRNSRRAVSEIIGTLLIVLATIGIGVVLVSTSAGSISTSVLNQQNQISIQTQHIQERSIVYDAWFHTATNGTRLLNIHLFDYGQVNIHIVTLYTNLTGSKSALGNFSTAYPTGFYVFPGQMVSFNVAFAYVVGNHYDILIVSDVGTTFESVWSA